jgi:hypothetical protein
MKAALALLLGLAAPALCALRAGAARIDITPRDPIWLAGYASRNHASTGVRLPIWARALAIDDGARRPVVIVSTDLVGLQAEVADQVAERVRARFGIERARLLLNSSHTHTGPVVWPGLASMFALPPGEEARLRDYSAHLIDDLVSVIGQSLADLSPAQLKYGTGEAAFAINRRQPSGDGFKIGVNPSGPSDHQVPVIQVTAPGGHVRAILFAYACHNTTLTGEFYEISGDYAGFAEAELESAHPGAAALFIALCGGDQNPDPRSSVELAARHGHALAAEVQRVLEGRLRALPGPLRAAYLTTSLPFAPQGREVYEKDLADPKAGPAFKSRARRMLDRPVSETAYPVQAIRFGRDLTLLALGGEAVIDYDLRAKREYPGEPLIVAAYSNSVMCYIPSERVLREGGYEAADNMVYYGQPGPFAPGVEDRVWDAIRRVMNAVGRSARPVTPLMR